MIFAVPIIGKILDGLAASEASAAATTQKTDSQTIQAPGGAAAPADFAQAVDNLDRAADARAAQHGAKI
jgi:hypothetical protein